MTSSLSPSQLERAWDAASSGTLEPDEIDDPRERMLLRALSRLTAAPPVSWADDLEKRLISNAVEPSNRVLLATERRLHSLGLLVARQLAICTSAGASLALRWQQRRSSS